MVLDTANIFYPNGGFPIEKWLEMTIAYFPHTVYLCTHKINNKK